jgi:hypothetical protein
MKVYDVKKAPSWLKIWYYVNVPIALFMLYSILSNRVNIVIYILLIYTLIWGLTIGRNYMPKKDILNKK